ncbi:MAG: transposase family protein [Planctomyces sp.]
MRDVAASPLAVLAGADGPTSIHREAKSLKNLPFLVDLPNGLPSHELIRRVLCALKPEAFPECFTKWPIEVGRHEQHTTLA